MSDEYRLSVIFCAVDESVSLEKTFRKIDQNQGVFEYLFVLSQTCTQACLRTVETLCERDDCRYFYQTGKGFGNAMQEGFAAARGTHVIVWSADEGTDTASFPEMLRISRENPDAIVSISRWLRKGGFEGYGRIRTAINFLSQKCFALLYRSDLTDFTNPTQIAPLAVYRAINWEWDGFEMLPEMTFKPLRLGVRFIEVPTRNVPRTEGRSHSRLLSLASYYVVIWRIRFMDIDQIRKEAVG